METVPDSIGIGSINYAIPEIGQTRSCVASSITDINVCKVVDTGRRYITYKNYHLTLYAIDVLDYY